MKRCTKCKTEFERDLELCPRDGELLVEVPFPAIPLLADTMAVGSGDHPMEGTSEIALEIEDLIFRTCPGCHSSFGGDIESCPEDGMRLSEPSLQSRKTLFFAGQDSTASVRELKKYCPECKRDFPLHLKACEACGATLVISSPAADAASQASAELIGLLIAGKYRIIKVLGEGGFKTVFLAKHEALEKLFAINMLKRRLSMEGDFRARFQEEALKLSRLEDENIVKVFDFGEWNDSPYMGTEYVEGRELSDLIYKEKATPLRASRIMSQVAGALAEAHSKKIVHLDLKPPNILVSHKRGRDLVKVIDFGIAEICSDGGMRQKNITGTPTYMAPEQWRGESLDPRADIYSFGVIFYEFLTGQPPFRSQSINELERAHCKVPPTPIRKLRPDIPAELERLIHRCLEKDREKRVRSAEELEAAVDGYVRRTENVILRWLRIAGIAAAVFLLLAAGALEVWNLRRDKEIPQVITFKATRMEGLVEAPSEYTERTYKTRADKVYKTRADKVQVELVASDNRGVDYLLVTSDALGGERSFSPDQAKSFELKVRDQSTTLVTAKAVDRSGNESQPAQIVFEWFPPPSIDAIIDNLQPDTNSKSLTLKIEKLKIYEAKAFVTCEYQDPKDPPFENEILEGRKFEIPLKTGTNRIKVGTKDLLVASAELDIKYQEMVNFLDSPFLLEAEVKDLLKLPEGKGWLTSKETVKLEVRAMDASRLPERAYLRFQLNSKGPQTLGWDRSDGGKKMTEIGLDEGENKITILEMEDRYGNRSEPRTLVVYRDQKAPDVKLLTKEVDYFSDAIPPVRFVASDQPPLESDVEFVLVGPGSKALDQVFFEKIPGEEGAWEVRFLDKALLSADGRQEFRIEAKDRVGNPTGAGTGVFTVIADHSPPEVTIQGPKPSMAFGKKEFVDLTIHASDGTFPAIDLKVSAKVSVAAPGFKHEGLEEPLSPIDPDKGLWGMKFPLSGLKPVKFDRLDPGFDLSVRAEDKAGHRSPPKVLHLAFKWENGDRLLWRDSSVLVYHEACPIRKVPEPFWMATTEVTNRHYLRFKDEKGAPSPRSPDWKDGKCLAEALDLPVRGLTVEEMRSYARWAGLEIPLRAQWLVAAFHDYDDPSEERRYPWRGKWPQGKPPVWAATGKTSPTGVDEKAADFKGGATPPPFGLVHMLGNVWEVVLDEKARQHVKVGGGFDTDLEVFRSEGTYRGYLRGDLEDEKTRIDPIRPEERSDKVGFRCVHATREK